MNVRILVLATLAYAMTAIPMTAQTCSSTTTTNTLICTLPQLFGPGGLTLPNKKHSAHFQDASINTFQPLNASIGEALSTLPLGSSGSATTFTLDSAGRPVPTLDSLGPILTERANVIGRRVYQVGVAYQYFSFGEIDGLNLHQLKAVLPHALEPGQTTPPLKYQNDYIQTTNQLNLALNQTVIYGVIGISNRIDASIEVPIDAVHFRVVSAAHIVRTQPCENQVGPGGGGNCYPPNNDDPNNPAANCGEFHWFVDTQTDCPAIFASTDATFPSSPRTTDATGIGDIILRGKYQVIKGEKLAGSIGIAFRLPSGDAKNFLGSGAVGVAPFGALTYLARLSPHVRFGYQWNGSSVLSGDPTTTTGSSASLPPEILYSAGADYRAMKRLTLTADLIGEYVLSASRMVFGTKNLFVGDTQVQAAIPTIFPTTASYSSDSIGVGGKVRVWNQLVAVGNVSFRIDNGGLHATAVPLVGLSYAF
jgi:hypothetical protein